jgi:hypothetical protein
MITKRNSRQLHNHFWILDRNNFGRCKCGATKQFSIEQEGNIKLKSLPKYDPSSWLRAGTVGVKIQEGI